jgi:hypothetical protein
VVKMAHTDDFLPLQADMRLIIADAKLTDGRTPLQEPHSPLSPAAITAFGAVTPGCCVVLLEEQAAAGKGAVEGAAPPPVHGHLSITCWKGWAKVTVFVDKDELRTIDSMLNPVATVPAAAAAAAVAVEPATDASVAVPMA